MKKTEVYSIMNPSPIGYEQINGDSECIPDQSLTVRQILDRFTRGLGVPGGKMPMYYGEDVEYPDFDRMDISERHDWVRQSKEFIDDTFKKANEQPEVVQPKESSQNIS